MSDLVHYQDSEKSKGKPINVNQLIMGQDPNGGHPYYPDLSEHTTNILTLPGPVLNNYNF